MTEQPMIGKFTKAAVDQFLAEPNLARIATVDPVTHQPHVVPVWFAWDGQSIWISSYSNTRKVQELKRNGLCSIVIDTAESGKAPAAVLCEGRAELVTEPRDEVKERVTRLYIKYLGEEGVLAPAPQEWIADSHNLLIKLTPDKIFAW